MKNNQGVSRIGLKESRDSRGREMTKHWHCKQARREDAISAKQGSNRLGFILKAFSRQEGGYRTGADRASK